MGFLACGMTAWTIWVAWLSLMVLCLFREALRASSAAMHCSSSSFFSLRYTFDQELGFLGLTVSSFLAPPGMSLLIIVCQTSASSPAIWGETLSISLCDDIRRKRSSVEARKYLPVDLGSQPYG